MASDILIAVRHERGVSTSHVREAFDTITDEDVSESSPVTAGVPEAGLSPEPGEIHVRVGGHAGDFTKTSEQALRKALRAIDGVESVEVLEGGYTPEE